MSDTNLGRVVPGYRAHYWFGRPLLLSSRTRGYVDHDLNRIIEAELALGCDGFVFRLNANPTETAFSRQMASFEAVLLSYSQLAFIYIEIAAQELEGFLLDIIKEHEFPRGYMFATRETNHLVNLYRLDCNPYTKMAIIADTVKDLSKVRRCPYTTVEILDALATHAHILEIHRSLKEVFVRAPFDREGSDIRNIEKRVDWLKHEKVDAIISNRTEFVLRVLSTATT